MVSDLRSHSGSSLVDPVADDDGGTVSLFYIFQIHALVSHGCSC